MLVVIVIVIVIVIVAVSVVVVMAARPGDGRTREVAHAIPFRRSAYAYSRCYVRIREYVQLTD
jgi:hypothetical protein